MQALLSRCFVRLCVCVCVCLLMSTEYTCIEKLRHSLHIVALGYSTLHLVIQRRNLTKRVKNNWNTWATGSCWYSRPPTRIAESLVFTTVRKFFKKSSIFFKNPFLLLQFCPHKSLKGKPLYVQRKLPYFMLSTRLVQVMNNFTFLLIYCGVSYTHTVQPLFT
jgi:hypothetical protein